MNINSNSLFHFTKTLDSLIGILSENFNLNYCLETFHYQNNVIKYAVPMVSFCKIPLSNIRDHIEKYGEYGIGLSYEWGNENNLNPVLYLNQTSKLSESLYFFLDENFTNIDISELNESQQKSLDILRYIKSYEGPLLRIGQENNNYRFADEIEWRYVSYNDHCSFIIPEEKYKEMGKSQANNEFLKGEKLVFEPKHIKYIIVNDDKEISEITSVLTKGRFKSFILEDIERLPSRILTKNQILTDF